MNITHTDSMDTDVTVQFAGGAERDSAWITVNLGPGRPSAMVNIIRADTGLRVNVYQLDREADAPVEWIDISDEELKVKP